MNNLVFIIGRLTSDCEIKYYESGKTKSVFTLAVDSYADNEKFTTFVKCEIWNKKAEFCAEYFKKGGIVTAYGELIKNEYEGKTYYNLSCKDAGFTKLTKIVKGNVTFASNNLIKIETSNEEIEAKMFIKDFKKPENECVFVLNTYFKNNEPKYILESIM